LELLGIFGEPFDYAQGIALPYGFFEHGGRCEFQPIAHNDTDDLSLKNMG
jgi:hypothetical protein